MTSESARHGKPAWKKSLERIHRGEEVERRRRRRGERCEAAIEISWPVLALEAARVKAELSHYEALLRATGHHTDAARAGRFIRKAIDPYTARQRENQA